MTSLEVRRNDRAIGPRNTWPLSRSEIRAPPSCFALYTVLITFVLAIDIASAMRGTLVLTKPFLLRKIRIGDILLPVSPVTVLVLLVSAIVLIRVLLSKSTAVASHILLDSDDAEERLKKMEAEIGNDNTKFADAARRYSKCPSGKAAGGSLGRIERGSMVPPFDKVVFNPENRIGQVLGPIRTQFGWHLILVTTRDL